MFYYSGDIMRAWNKDTDTDFSGILLDEKLNKKKEIFQFMKIDTKFQQVQNHCVLGTIK